MALTKVNPGVIADTIQTVGFKNKIIGGDFTTNPWQRGTSFAAVVSGAYTADRWSHSKSGTAVFTISKSTDAPTSSQTGIYTGFSLGLAVTTAQSTVASGDFAYELHRIEGFNSASFGFGQAGTRTITLSFWVKGTKTGIHCVALRNGSSTRSYISEYTIIAINAWEYKTITIPVDVAGTWLYDTGAGLEVGFTLVSGSTFNTTANSWQTGNFLATANQVNELDTVGNNFKIALVQLEAGDKVSKFETRSIGQELALCERYYEVGGFFTIGYSVSAGANIGSTVKFRVRKRSSATVIQSSTSASNCSSTTAQSSTGDNADSFLSFRSGTATGGAQYSETWIASAEL